MIDSAKPPRDGSAAPATIAGWKGIAAYFGRDERTVMRWAAERGLPVRRMPGQKRASVYALPDELAAWLVADPAPAPVDAPMPAAPADAPVTVPPVPATSRRAPALRWALAAAVAAVAIAGGIAMSRGSADRPPATRSDSPAAAARNPAAEAAYLQARYDFAQRTPASLRRAATEFGAAIAADPQSAASYAGLGETYLLLRQYSDMPNAIAYARARAAAQAALALDDHLAAAHRVLAFVAFWWASDIPTARREFARALELAPNDAQTHHWYATALSANGEAAAALREIVTARRLDPNSTAILAGTGLLTYLAGNPPAARAMLHTVIANHPDESSSHQYLADIALDEGDDATFLAEAARAAALRGDADRATLIAAARRGSDAGGRAGMLHALYDALAAARGPQGSWFGLAQIAALQGDAALAVELLRRADAAHDPALMTLRAHKAFAALASRPEFIALAQRPSLQPGG